MYVCVYIYIYIYVRRPLLNSSDRRGGGARTYGATWRLRGGLSVTFSPGAAMDRYIYIYIYR